MARLTDFLLTVTAFIYVRLIAIIEIIAVVVFFYGVYQIHIPSAWIALGAILWRVAYNLGETNATE